jgi:predicted ATPase
MINNIRIKNFKALVEEELNFKNLTILAGTNSSGKSSVIQALLLYASEITGEKYSSLSKYLNFLRKDKNGLLNFNVGAKEFSIQINNTAKLCYKKGEKSFKVLGEVEGLRDKLSYEKESLIYLCADRIGTREFYLKNDNSDIDKIGIYGEYAMDYFEYHKSEPIETYLMVDKNNQTLALNVNYWLYHIVNSELRTEDGGDDIKAFFAYKTDKTSKAKFVNPRNIGSGTGYLISIIIACLSAKKNNIIIIENPEIHLHPKAQSRLIELFTFVANQNIQIIIETHSDHVFNGIRKAIYQKKILIDIASINFRRLNDETLLSENSEILLTEHGRILNQQSNLFDQFDTDTKELLGLNSFIKSR